jgi:Fe-S cluster biogenesis protein NfuA
VASKPRAGAAGRSRRLWTGSWQTGLVDTETTLTDDERAGRLAELNQLLELIRPAVQADGGDLVLRTADLETGTVEVQLQGSCSSCAISSTTLQAGVERILKDRLPWVTEVIGGVDETLDYETSSAMGRGGYTPSW